MNEDEIDVNSPKYKWQQANPDSTFDTDADAQTRQAETDYQNNLRVQQANAEQKAGYEAAQKAQQAKNSGNINSEDTFKSQVNPKIKDPRVFGVDTWEDMYKLQQKVIGMSNEEKKNLDPNSAEGKLARLLRSSTDILNDFEGSTADELMDAFKAEGLSRDQIKEAIKGKKWADPNEAPKFARLLERYGISDSSSIEDKKETELATLKEQMLKTISSGIKNDEDFQKAVKKVEAMPSEERLKLIDNYHKAGGIYNDKHVLGAIADIFASANDDVIYGTPQGENSKTNSGRIEGNLTAPKASSSSSEKITPPENGSDTPPEEKTGSDTPPEEGPLEGDQPDTSWLKDLNNAYRKDVRQEIGFPSLHNLYKAGLLGDPNSKEAKWNYAQALMNHIGAAVADTPWFGWTPKGGAESVSAKDLGGGWKSWYNQVANSDLNQQLKMRNERLEQQNKDETQALSDLYNNYMDMGVNIDFGNLVAKYGDKLYKHMTDIQKYASARKAKNDAPLSKDEYAMFKDPDDMAAYTAEILGAEKDVKTAEAVLKKAEEKYADELAKAKTDKAKADLQQIYANLQMAREQIEQAKVDTEIKQKTKGTTIYNKNTKNITDTLPKANVNVGPGGVSGGLSM